MFAFLAGLVVDPFATDRDFAAKPPLAFLWQELKPFRAVIVASLALTLFTASLEVWLVGAVGALVDQLGRSTPDRLWAEHGVALLGGAVLVLIVRPLAGYLREAIDDIAFRQNATYRMLWRSHRYLLRQPVGWFRNDLAGRIANWVQANASAGTTTAYSVLHTVAYVGVYLVGAIGLVGTIDWRLTLPLLVWMALYATLAAIIVPRMTKAIATYQESYSQLSGHLVDSYANIETLKVFGAGGMDATGDAAFHDARGQSLHVQRLEVTLNSGMLALNSLLLVGLIGYAVVLWQAGAAPVGLVAIAMTLSFRLTGLAEWLLDAITTFFNALGAFREGLKTVAQPLAITDVAGARPLIVSSGAVAFEAVTHRYGRDDGGLADLSLHIGGGEKIGLVGRSGAGKSTMVNLLLRYFDPEAGAIRIDGQRIDQVTQDSLHRSIAIVPQDASLLHRSVRDNIAFGREDVSDAEIVAAARKAEAHDFILELRDSNGGAGYDGRVGERGVLLSGGQRQRIALARAILKNAPILILDEATSALDSEAEAAIQSALGMVMEGKTVLAIAHRLSTLARMDRIVVLDGGRIAEAGTHAELLGHNGLYAALWSRQSGGFI